MGDALSVVLLNCKKFKESDFRRNHPGGSLGERLKIKVGEVMMTGGQIPQVLLDSSLPEAIKVLNDRNLGAVLIMDDEDMIGIITDGDIRRIVSQGTDLKSLDIAGVMSKNPKTIKQDLMAADALSIMQRHEIRSLVHNPRSDTSQLLHVTACSQKQA